MSLGNDPSRFTTLDGAEAMAAVSETVAELRRDGPAPREEEILEAMGRTSTGEPMQGVETLAPHKAGKVARALIGSELESSTEILTGEEIRRIGSDPVIEISDVIEHRASCDKDPETEGSR